jgi:hypothetical protein
MADIEADIADLAARHNASDRRSHQGMGSLGEDRLQLRLKHLLLVVVGAISGAYLPAGAMTGDPGRLLTTFMGFFTAGVLPTISILIGSMSAAGRSVKALNDVRDEIRSAIYALLQLLLLAGATVAVMFLVSIPAALSAVTLSTTAEVGWLTYLPSVKVTPSGTIFDLTDMCTRLGQGLIVSLTIIFALKASALPRVLRAALDSKHNLAIDEARRNLEGRAPKAEEIKKSFSGGLEFGAVVRVEQNAP